MSRRFALAMRCQPKVLSAVLTVLAIIYKSKVVACPIPLPSVDVDVNGTTLSLEVAATREARACGLSHREYLSPEQGMLFVVPKPIKLDFWMNDTSLPLSIAFLDDSRRVLSIQKMRPRQNREHYVSPASARYAIEVNQGWFDEHNVRVGDIIELKVPAILIVN